MMQTILLGISVLGTEAVAVVLFHEIDRAAFLHVLGAVLLLMAWLVLIGIVLVELTRGRRHGEADEIDREEMLQLHRQGIVNVRKA